MKKLSPDSLRAADLKDHPKWLVLNKETAKKLGNTPEERLEKAIQSEPLLREKRARATRVTVVLDQFFFSEKPKGPQANCDEILAWDVHDADFYSVK